MCQKFAFDVTTVASTIAIAVMVVAILKRSAVALLCISS